MLKKLVRRALFIFACLTTLVALFYAEEDWRGKHAWEEYKRGREAKGDSFEWSSVVPPPVPDDQNFAAIPLFAELFPKPPPHPRLDAVRLPDCPPGRRTSIDKSYWRTGQMADLSAWQECFTNADLLAALAQHDPILREVTEASRRPYCRFPIRYEDNYAALLPHLNRLRQLTRVYRLRALAELAAGQTNAAYNDVQMCLRLADKLKDEPIVISFLVRNAILDGTAQPVWEGLAAHRWNESQLAALQFEFENIDPFDGYAKALRGERILACQETRSMRDDPSGFASLFFARGFVTESSWLDRVIPSGWFYRDQVSLDRFYTETILPAVDWEHQYLSPKTMLQVENSLEAMRFTPYNILCKVLLAAQAVLAKKAAIAQTTADEAAVACALERYRLARGEFPEKLDALAPQFMSKLPHDVIDGGPLHYRRAADGQYVLYSIGWNEVDDGGQVGLSNTHPPGQDINTGDWVWFSQPQAQPSASERK